MSQQWTIAADDMKILTQDLEDRLKASDSPRQRLILQTLIEHVRTEGYGDLDAVMATLSPQAAFLHPDGTGPNGLDEIRGYYSSIFARGGIGNLLVRNVRVIADDDAVVNEVTLFNLVPWQLAKERGYNVQEEAGHYAIWRRICTVLPFDADGKLCGEIRYEALTNPNDCERVPDAELTPGYWKWLQGSSDS